MQIDNTVSAKLGTRCCRRQWCLLVCHPHLTIIICCPVSWAQACGVEHKTNHFPSLDHSASALVFISLLVEQYHDTATSGTYNSDLRNCDNSCSVCVGKHGTVSRYCRFCARLGDGRSTVGSEASRGTKPCQDNGKELMRRQQWDRGLDSIHLQVSQRQHWRTHIDNGNAIFDSGRRPRSCRRTSREDGFLRQLQQHGNLNVRSVRTTRLLRGVALFDETCDLTDEDAQEATVRAFCSVNPACVGRDLRQVAIGARLDSNLPTVSRARVWTDSSTMLFSFVSAHRRSLVSFRHDCWEYLICNHIHSVPVVVPNFVIDVELLFNIIACG